MPSGSRREPRPNRTPQGIWAASPTPFLSDGELDREGIRQNARHFADALGLNGIFCNGLMGEGWALDPAERRMVVEAVLEATSTRLAVGVVVTHHSQKETIELARHAEHVGAHHVVLMRPRAPLSEDELCAHVGAIAEKVSLPIVLFESAAPGMGFGETVIARLAEQGSIAAVKATQGFEAAAHLRERCGGKAVVADPLEENWLTNLLRFDLQVLYADPEPYLYQRAGDQPIRAYFEAFRRNDVGAAWEIREALKPLRRIYNRWILGPLNRGRPPNAALKAWCELMGLAGGPVRPPLKPLDQTQKHALMAELRATRLVEEVIPSASVPGMEAEWKF